MQVIYTKKIQNRQCILLVKRKKIENLKNLENNINYKSSSTPVDSELDSSFQEGIPDNTQNQERTGLKIRTKNTNTK